MVICSSDTKKSKGSIPLTEASGFHETVLNLLEEAVVHVPEGKQSVQCVMFFDAQLCDLLLMNTTTTCTLQRWQVPTKAHVFNTTMHKHGTWQMIM